MSNIYDSGYSITIDINTKLGNEPKFYDSVHSICIDIYNKLGGEETDFDSIYSILEAIMDLKDIEHSNVFDSIYSQCLKIYNSLGGEPTIFDSTYSILLGILPLIDVPVVPPDDEIWYTSTDGNVVQLISTSGFPEIISNTYSNGKGVIKFASNITSVVNWAFGSASKLASVELPNSVLSIGAYAFSGTNLTAIEIPINVTTIYTAAFDACWSLASVTIPAGVTNIGDEGFSRCSSLTNIVYNGTMEQWGNITLGTYWNNRVPATVVHCTDGDVTL